MSEIYCVNSSHSSSHSILEFEYDLQDAAYFEIVDAMMCVHCKRPALLPVKHGQHVCVWRYCSDCPHPSIANPCVGRLCLDRTNSEMRLVQDPLVASHDTLKGRCKKCRASFTRRDFLVHTCDVVPCPQGCGCLLTGVNAAEVRRQMTLESSRESTSLVEPEIFAETSMDTINHYRHCARTLASCVGTTCSERMLAGEKSANLLRHIQDCASAQDTMSTWKLLISRIDGLSPSSGTVASGPASASASSPMADELVRVVDENSIDSNKAVRPHKKARTANKKEANVARVARIPPRPMSAILAEVPRKTPKWVCKKNDSGTAETETNPLFTNPPPELKRILGISNKYNQPPTIRT